MFVEPMLASPPPKPKQVEGTLYDEWAKLRSMMKPGLYTAQIKYDGHRLVSEISDGLQQNLFVKKGITAWSRYGIERKLPSHLIEAMAELPNGLFDGELVVPGQRSYGVTELINSKKLEYVIFDAINVDGDDYTDLDLDTRYYCLKMQLAHLKGTTVRLAPTYNVDSLEEALRLRDKVWEQDEEGLILKKRSGLYMIGKRSKDLIKLKDKKSAVVTVVAWAESRGEIQYRGAFATAIVRDEFGKTTTVKTKNNAEIERLEAEARRTGKPPFLGRELRIEYQEKTPDGSYRHPRWDRWEDE